MKRPEKFMSVFSLSTIIVTIAYTIFPIVGVLGKFFSGML
jgi:hypothetical protein